MPHRTASTEELRATLIAGTPFKERRLRLAGIDTAVLEAGSGAPLVLLHGPGEHGCKWLRVTPILAQRYRVIAPDLPGHGASEAGEPAPDATRVLDWLGALIRETCAEPPVLVGQIVGGAIAARFAARGGAPLRALVLADTLGLQPFQPAPEFGQALMGYLGNPDEATHDRLWERCAYDLAALRESLGERWAALKAYNLDRARAPGLAQVQQQLMADFGLPAMPGAELERISVPTSLIWGRHDLATPLSVAQAAAARYGWPLHVVEDAGDDPAMEQPDAFVRALDAAVAERRQAVPVAP